MGQRKKAELKTFKQKVKLDQKEVGMSWFKHNFVYVCVWLRADSVLFENSSIQSNTHTLMIFGIFDIVHSASHRLRMCRNMNKYSIFFFLQSVVQRYGHCCCDHLNIWCAAYFPFRFRERLERQRRKKLAMLFSTCKERFRIITGAYVTEAHFINIQPKLQKYLKQKRWTKKHTHTTLKSSSLFSWQSLRKAQN